MGRTYDLVLLPGDGIGIDVMAEAKKVLKALVEIFGFDMPAEEIPCGGRYYLKDGARDWPEGSEERCAKADLLLLGAVGWPDPDRPGPVTMKNGRMAGFSPVIGLRAQLNLYANVRPVQLFEGVHHKVHGKPRSIWEPGKVDMTFVRENTEGLYSGIGGTLERGGKKPVAIDTRVITREGSERVIRYAFEVAKRRGRGAPATGKSKVTCIVKDNVMEGCRLFRDVFYEIGEEYPEIEKEKSIIDAFTQWLIKGPEFYDTLVTTNLFGDIITDLASVLQGGMGLAVGCNVGDQHAMFEPIHGSAPKYSGKDRANPLAMVLALKEGLDWLGGREGDADMVKAAGLIDRAVRDQLIAGEIVTADIVGDEKASGTSAVGDETVRRIIELAG